MTLLFLILGIAGLWIASEIAINGALDIADHYKVSRGFIGLTVIAIGTGVPELFVSVTAAVNRVAGTETSGFVFGQIIGSCFGNVALLLGLAGLFVTLTMTRGKLLRDGLMMVAAAVLLFLLGYDGVISRMDGLLLIIIYVVYFVSLIREEKMREKLRLQPKRNLMKAMLFTVGGFILLGFAADITVRNALILSVQWGIAQSVVGALIVGLGTSLPEFVTSLAALKKGQGELAVGNLIGSTTFDMLLALGSAAAISGLLVSKNILYIDLVMLVVLALLVFAVLWSRLRLSRREAAFLIIAYIIYVGAKLGGTV